MFRLCVNGLPLYPRNSHTKHSFSQNKKRIKESHRGGSPLFDMSCHYKKDFFDSKSWIINRPRSKQTVPTERCDIVTKMIWTTIRISEWQTPFSDFELFWFWCSFWSFDWKTIKLYWKEYYKTPVVVRTSGRQISTGVQFSIRFNLWLKIIFWQKILRSQAFFIIKDFL